MQPALVTRSAQRRASAVMTSRCSAAYASTTAQALFEVAHQADRRLLPGQRRRDPLDVLGERRPGGRTSRVDGVGELGGVGDQDGRGQRVVLGLADQVGGDVHRVGGGIGEHGDLGRAGLGVDPDDAADQPLGRSDVDVARAGDHVHRIDAERGVAVGRQGDGLRPADRVDLGDAEQRARREDRRVRPAAELLLRRREHSDRADAGDLGGDDVHHHAGRVDGEAAGHVQADPRDRDPPLGDPAAGHDLDVDRLAALRLVHDPRAADGLDQRRADVRVEQVERSVQRGGRDARVGHVHPVEAQRWPRAPRGSRGRRRPRPAA